MATEDPNYDYLLRRVEELEQLLRSNPLRSASVSRGITEFRDDSTLLITDSNMRVVGVAYVSGRLEGEGTLSWSGQALLDGPVEITDTLDVLAATRLRGETTIEGLARLLSELVVEGKITAGNVRIEGGRIYVGVGGAQVVIDGATGQIISGALTIDPTADGGAVLFSNGSKMYSNVTAIGLRKGNSAVTIGDTLAGILVGGKALTVTEDGIALTGIREVSSTDGLKWLGITNTGEVVKVAPGVGGPGGSLQWPFPPSMVTSEYGPREVTIEGASSFHEGIDFGAAPGAPIPAAGSGTVTTAGMSGGFGNLVVINHGGGIETYYAHMQTTPYVSVGQVVPRGHILGPVGKTGVSGGEHLHFEVHVNGSPVNPRSKLPAA